MTTKEYLSQISRCNRMIRNKVSEISQLRELENSFSEIRGREKADEDNDKIGTSCVKIEEMERRLDEMIDEYVCKKELIVSQIDSMEDEVSYDILFARYIEKKTLERIAESLHYSFRQITRLHGKALQEFEKKYGYLYLGEENLFRPS